MLWMKAVLQLIEEQRNEKNLTKTKERDIKPTPKLL